MSAALTKKALDIVHQNVGKSARDLHQLKAALAPGHPSIPKESEQWREFCLEIVEKAIADLQVAYEWSEAIQADRTA